MRNIVYYIFLGALISCGENNSHSEVAAADTVISKSQPDKVFDYPVVFKNWKMGDHANMRVVLQMYKAWDEDSVNAMASLIDDTLTMELPDGRRFSAGKEAMLAELLKSRSKYRNTSSEIVAAYPVVNTDNNDQWVNVLVYNKWSYKDNVRDSMLYEDLWKIRNGRINSLISLEQRPSRFGLEKLEKLVQ